MAAFSDLPDEILLLICEALVVWESVKSLLYVNKRLYAVAQPLFRIHRQVSNRGREQRHFCAKAVLRDKLAKTVGSVDTDTCWAHDEYADKASALSDGKKENIDDEAVIDRLVARVCDIFHDDDGKRREWQRGIEVQNTKYMLPLALAHLPNLSDLQMPHGFETGFWDNIGVIFTQMQSDSRLADEKKPFQKVEHVYIEGANDKYPTPPLPLATVARWPAVRSFEMSTAGNEEGDEVEAAFTELQPKSSGFEHLELCPNSKLLGGNLHGLLGASCGLREFKYHVGHSWAWIDFHTPELQEALDQQRETLERLTLWYDLMELDAGSDSVVRPMNFSAYTHLTHLSIETMFLFETDNDSDDTQQQPPPPPPPPSRLAELLPASLRYLHVVQVVASAAKRVAGGLKVFLEEHSRDFPDLKTLEVSCSRDYLINDGLRALVANTGLRDLEALAKKMGIEFRLIECYDDLVAGIEFSDTGLLDPEKDVELEQRENSS